MRETSLQLVQLQGAIQSTDPLIQLNVITNLFLINVVINLLK